MSKAAVEYLHPDIANEGMSANNWSPGAWTNTPATDGEEYQPDLEPPHNNDYAALKKHKHYRQYFRPYRYVPFPAFLFHMTLGSKIVKSKEEAVALGSEWTRFVPVHYHPAHGKLIVKSMDEVAELGQGWAPGIFDIDRGWVSGRDMTGKSLPVKNDTQRLTEALVRGMSESKQGADPAQIAAIVAAVMQAVGQPAGALASQKLETEAEETLETATEHLMPTDQTEREALLALAGEKSLKVDGRWSNDRIKKELGLE